MVFDHENKMFSSIALKFGSDTTFFIRGNYFLHDFLPNNKVSENFDFFFKQNFSVTFFITTSF